MLPPIEADGWGTATVGDGSVRGAVTSTDWPVLRAGRLQVLAGLAGLGDILTTYVVLTSATYVEYNPVIDAFAAEAVVLAMAYFVALNATYAAVGVVDLGWLSTGTATFHALLMGSATLNNLVLFAVGTSPLDVLGGTVAFRAKVPVAAVLALAVAVRSNDRPPTAEVLAAGAVLAAGMAVH